MTSKCSAPVTPTAPNETAGAEDLSSLSLAPRRI